jgi:hypothetical protein
MTMVLRSSCPHSQVLVDTYDVIQGNAMSGHHTDELSALFKDIDAATVHSLGSACSSFFWASDATVLTMLKLLPVSKFSLKTALST